MYDQRLVKILLASSPSSVVLVGEPVFRLSAELEKPIAESEYGKQALSVAKTDRIEAYLDECKVAQSHNADAVMCLDLPCDQSDPESVLGLACRVSPRLVLVEQTTQNSASALPDELFFAFGFRVIEKFTEAKVRRALYTYSLSDYKQAPDWLNARFWANPERFDVPN